MNKTKLYVGACNVLLVLSAISGFEGRAQAAAVLVNGSCLVGDCSTANVLAAGASVSQPFSLQYSFANTDRYQLTGTLGAENDSAIDRTIRVTAADLVLTYLGNASASASAADTLVIDFLQYFRTPFSNQTNSLGSEYVRGTFGGPLADASSVQAQASSNGGTAMALMGPFYSPDAFTAFNTNQPGTVGPTSLLQFRDTITFGEGSGVGSTITLANIPAVATPEPSTTLLLATGALFLLSRLRRR